jgi:hypothetical protein
VFTVPLPRDGFHRIHNDKTAIRQISSST